jgi:hypothetical protein
MLSEALRQPLLALICVRQPRVFQRCIAGVQRLLQFAYLLVGKAAVVVCDGDEVVIGDIRVEQKCVFVIDI